LSLFFSVILYISIHTCSSSCHLIVWGRLGLSDWCLKKNEHKTKKLIWGCIIVTTLQLNKTFWLTTAFVDKRLLKTKHPRKRFQNFRQSYMLSTDRIEIHQSQPLVWPSDFLYVMLAGGDWWISIRYVDNTLRLTEILETFPRVFAFQSRVSKKTVVKSSLSHWVSESILC